MNVLVTGAGGFLGAAIANRLEGGHRVLRLLHDSSPPEFVWANDYLLGDVTDYARMLEIIVNFEIDQIYHCAARSVVRNCRLDPLGCFRVNVMGTACVLEAARQSERVKGVMCMESDKVYGAGPLPYKEDQALLPAAVYESSKACVSHLVAAYYQNYSLPVFGVRSANVYGPGDPNMSRIVPNTISRLKRGERPQIVEGAEGFVREYIYVDDFVSYVVALMAKAPWGESVNVGSGCSCSVAVVVRTICQFMGKSMEVEFLPRPETFTEIPNQRLNLFRLREMVPVVSPLGMWEGLERTVEAWGDD